MRKLVIDQHGAWVEQDDYTGVPRDPSPNLLVWRYFNHWCRIHITSIRYLPEPKP